MSDKNYECFFEKIREFKKEQQKQKQRGLNDFNILSAVRKPHAEVGMHSNFLYAILNPNGLHYQGDLFVKLFIKYVLKIDNFGDNIIVRAEEPTTENRRIDFTIKSDKYLIGIEMKIYANDENHQIFDYYEELQKQNENKKENKAVEIYYLTIDGKKASEQSYTKNDVSVTYKSISFNKHILKWLEECVKEIGNITNLNEAFKQYTDVVKMITNKYEGKIMKLKDRLMNNDAEFKLAKEISSAYIEANKEKTEKIKEEAFIRLKNLLGENIQFEPLEWLATNIISDKFYIRIIAQDNQYLVQVTNKCKPFEIVGIEKSEILNNLQAINNNFKSAYNKVYGQIEINHDDLRIDFIQKIINLK